MAWHLKQKPRAKRTSMAIASFLRSWAHILVVVLAAASCIQPCQAQAVYDCSSEWQIVQCGQIPYEMAEERQRCCLAFKPVVLPPAVRAAQVAAIRTAAVQSAQVADARPDLTGPPPQLATAYQCTARVGVQIPGFTTGSDTVTVSEQQVPKQLSTAAMQAVKDKALSNFNASFSFRYRYNMLRRVNPDSGFMHPAGIVGIAELLLMQERLSAAPQPQPQKAALVSLINGTGVPPKLYPGGWAPPVDCPPQGYGGPYPMTKVQAAFGGTNSGTCNVNYPTAAPQGSCAHISFVELDGQMAYKQALAYWAAGNSAHAVTATKILEAWPAVNTEWGILEQNGPLEAGWGCAAMARALELLKHSDWIDYKESTYDAWVKWVNGTLMPQMEWYVYQFSAKLMSYRVRNPYVLANWHSTIAECWMAVGVLTDDRSRFDKGLRLARRTITEYLKVGRRFPYKENRTIGECGETLRDIYHSEFGLGGLLQAAEIAFQQNIDLYNTSDHALASAMELHARIITAGTNSTLLPPGFRFFADMPKPVNGTEWAFDIQQQKWYSRRSPGGAFVAWLNDGIRYVVGSKHLPTGWETGFNHYVHRLGMSLPETTKLLAQNSPDWFEFHWGLGTLTHGNTAGTLWSPGVNSSTVCGR